MNISYTEELQDSVRISKETNNYIKCSSISFFKNGAPIFLPFNTHQTLYKFLNDINVQNEVIKVKQKKTEYSFVVTELKCELTKHKY